MIKLMGKIKQLLHMFKLFFWSLGTVQVLFCVSTARGKETFNRRHTAPSFSETWWNDGTYPYAT